MIAKNSFIYAHVNSGFIFGVLAGSKLFKLQKDSLLKFGSYLTGKSLSSQSTKYRSSNAVSVPITSVSPEVKLLSLKASDFSLMSVAMLQM